MPARTAHEVIRQGALSPSRLVGVTAACLGLACGAIALHVGPELSLPDELDLPVAATLIVGAAVLAAMARRPEIGVHALLVLVWANLSEILVRRHDLPSVLRILLPLLALALLASTLSTRGALGSLGVVVRRRGAGSLPRPARFVLAAGAYLAWHVASGSWAVDPSLSQTSSMALGKAVLLGALVAIVPSSAGLWRRATWTIVLTGAVLAALSSFQVVTDSWASDFGGLARAKLAHVAGSTFRPRASGPLADPNYHAQALLVLVPIALAHAVAHPTRALRRLALVAAGIITLGVLTTYSRGGALTLAFVACLFAWTVRRKLRPGHVVAAVVIGLLLLPALPGLVLDRVATLGELIEEEEGLQKTDSSIAKRRVLMGAAASMAIDSPLRGVGAGNYTTHFEEHGDRIGATGRIYNLVGEQAYPHSLYLETWAETGLVGLVLFALAVAAALLAAAAAARRFEAAGEDALALLARALAIGVVGYLISSTILHADYVRYLWVLLGLTAAAAGVAPRPVSAGVAGDTAASGVTTHAAPGVTRPDASESASEATP